MSLMYQFSQWLLVDSFCLYVEGIYYFKPFLEEAWVC